MGFLCVNEGHFCLVHKYPINTVIYGIATSFK